MKNLFSFLLASFCLFASCKKKEAKAAQTPVITAPADTTTIPVNNDTTTGPTRYFLALGDSYTIGQSVPDSMRFPVQTVKLLGQRNRPFYPPEIIATTGWTTANLLNRLNTTPPLRSSYDIVTLLIGVNNQYQGLNQSDYSSEFTFLLSKAIQYAGNRKERVIVLSIPDYSVTPFAAGYNRLQIAAEIDAFNRLNYQIAAALGVQYLNITGYTRLAATDPSLIAYDGLHPSGKEYKVWADTLAPLIQTILR